VGRLNLNRDLVMTGSIVPLGQSIAEIDDSAVDHIKQYWKGGQTIPENARLTHRYCNWARARSES
jgi:HNH endonuclease